MSIKLRTILSDYIRNHLNWAALEQQYFQYMISHEIIKYSKAYTFLINKVSADACSAYIKNIVISFKFMVIGQRKIEFIRPEQLTIAKQYMKENYTKDISVADIAGAAGISQSFLYQLFKQQEKHTPIEMLRTLRIQNAKLLLLSEKSYKISQVASMCGFSNSAYFCKVFKNETGISANAFRKLNKV